MRRAIRVKKNEGQVLEDLGIHPDVIYRMTRRDILESNQDLNTRAAMKLSKMPVYGLEVKVAWDVLGCTLTCTTLHLDSLEVFVGSRFLAGALAHDDAATELSMPNQPGRIEVRGLVANAIVASKVIDLTAEKA